jgi:hypothetical protein
MERGDVSTYVPVVRAVEGLGEVVVALAVAAHWGDQRVLEDGWMGLTIEEFILGS